jgi:membrane-associated phospholipid phosphatase
MAMSEILASPNPSDILMGMILGVLLWHLLRFIYHAFMTKESREHGKLLKEIDALETRHEINKLKRRKGMLERKFPRG